VSNIWTLWASPDVLLSRPNKVKNKLLITYSIPQILLLN